MNYYNDNDPKSAAWLRELIKDGLIPKGEVDERSIADVKPGDLDGFIQCHFFAGIGGWPYALRLAGWPDEKPVWTGSCPCQPFSASGKGQVDKDERHLWPAFRTLITERRPAIVFGEQVASKDGRIWLAGVRADLEALGYGVGAADLCAAGIGSPMVSQRLHWVASSRHEPQGWTSKCREKEGWRTHGEPPRCGCNVLGLGATNMQGSQGRVECIGSSGKRIIGTHCAWSDWEPCHFSDGKVRRIKSGLEPLANGVPARVVRLRGYGNAIVPQLAAEFVGAFMDVLISER